MNTYEIIESILRNKSNKELLTIRNKAARREFERIKSGWSSKITLDGIIINAINRKLEVRQ